LPHRTYTWEAADKAAGTDETAWAKVSGLVGRDDGGDE
jgi:hypothetical protein